MKIILFPLLIFYTNVTIKETHETVLLERMKFHYIYLYLGTIFMLHVRTYLLVFSRIHYL